MLNTRGKQVLLIGALIIAIALGFWFWSKSGDGLPPPPFTASRIRNTDLETAYVGSKTCIECHEQEHETYSRTQHNIALREVSATPPPPKGECQHALSGRAYKIYYDGEKMRHREWIPSSHGDLELANHAPLYAVGSGAHAFTYLIRQGDFLLESPVTYYSPIKKWDLSPGYEKTPNQPGFARPIATDCINCHSGGAVEVDNSAFKFKIREKGIGCERCHGPGGRHVEKWRRANEGRGARGDADENSVSNDEADDTIANPAHLSRELVNGICSQCHLEGSARISVRGRRGADFRPGLKFSEFQIAFRVKAPDDAMTVVGHVEQLRASKCYTQSKMTCVTCHNPHEAPLPEDRKAYFRDQCLQCHEVDSCGLKTDDRKRHEKDDNCNSCHMPQAEVNVPHVAFTHHRIAVHLEPPPAPPKHLQVGELAAIDDISHLSPIDQERCFGLAYLELAEGAGEGPAANHYAKMAGDLLGSVWSQGMRDPDVEAGLARLQLDAGNFSRARSHAHAALASSRVSPRTRVDALDTLANSYFKSGYRSQAETHLEQLVTLRLDADDWQRLAICRRASGDRAGAAKAMQAAIDIAPHRADIQASASEAYQQAGDSDKAEYHRQRAEALGAPPGR